MTPGWAIGIGVLQRFASLPRPKGTLRYIKEKENFFRHSDDAMRMYRVPIKRMN